MDFSKKYIMIRVSDIILKLYHELIQQKLK